MTSSTIFYFSTYQKTTTIDARIAAAHKMYDALVASGMSEKEAKDMIEDFHSDAYCDGYDEAVYDR